MTTRTITILYWVFTIIFAGLMIFSAYGSIIVNEDAKNLISSYLKYPEYFIPFTGWAKLIGSIVILIPGLKTVKEWAYAGLFFDLLGATYSGIRVDGFQPEMAFMLLPFSIGALSYIYHHKRLKVSATA